MQSSFPWPKRRIQVLSCLCVVVLATLLTACGGSNVSSSSTSGVKASVPAPKDLLTAGTLTVGSDTTYPPQESVDPISKAAVGFDIDLINEISARMGLTTSVVKTDFTTIIDSLSNKRFDVVISAVTVNPERLKKADFVNYFNAGESLLVQTANPLNLKTTADLCGQNVGVQKGTIEQDDLTTASSDCVKNGKQRINLTVLQNQTDVIQLLATKRVVATYQDSPVADYYIKQNPGQFAVGGSIVNAAPEGIAVRKGNTAMLNAVQKAFDAMKADGTYHKLILKWGLINEEIR